MFGVPLAVSRLPSVDAKPEGAVITRAGVAALLRLPVFRRVVLVAALILGSHSMHDTFSVIRWRAAGISPQTISLLWSVSVAEEVLVFFVVGPWLLRKLTPAGAPWRHSAARFDGSLRHSPSTPWRCHLIQRCTASPLPSCTWPACACSRKVSPTPLP